MPTILQVLICSLIGGLVSLSGGLLLLASKKRASLAEYATSFAAGALLASAFIDMLPEALEEGDSVEQICVFVLLGLTIFFLLEVFLGWFHRHGDHNEKHIKPVDPVIPMIVIGDTIHNIIDGVAIAAGFLVSPTSGIIVTLAVAAHEIPQEVGDFGLLLHKGVNRKKVLLINVLSSLATTISAVLAFIIGENFNLPLAPILAIVAGFFIYIASSDLIPSIHSDKSQKSKIKKAVTMITGIIIVGFAIVTLHGLAHQSDHDHHDHHDHASAQITI